jgi:serine-protein kinase ATM
MGPLGTEGVFTRAAETTLSALKNNSAALLTILSAIVADPLYKWTLQKHDQKRDTNVDSVRNGKNSISKSQARLSNIPRAVINLQHEDSNKSKNEAAEHAIRKISEKLQGYEDGTAGEQQSIIGQVSFLVNSARDSDNLSAMFPGWAPWV